MSIHINVYRKKVLTKRLFNVLVDHKIMVTVGACLVLDMNVENHCSSLRNIIVFE